MEVLIRGSFQLLVSVRPCWKLRTRAVVVDGYKNTALFIKKTATDAVKTPRKSVREREAVLNYWYIKLRIKGKDESEILVELQSNLFFSNFPPLSMMKTFRAISANQMRAFCIVFGFLGISFSFSRFVTLPVSLAVKRLLETAKLTKKKVLSSDLNILKCPKSGLK